MPPQTDAARVMLRLSGVTKELGGRAIVADLDLDVRAGELVCLLGASGCGKTTTLRLIGGFLTPDAGRVEIDGVDYTSAPPERRPTAMVFQNYALWPHMTVFDNVAFGLKLRKLKKPEVAARVEAALTTVGLMHHIRSRPGEISGGEQQRVALARALVLEPSVLLLDEPLSNLDAKLRVRVREEIRELQRRSGITMVLVTHDQEEALATADRIAVMNEGRIEQYDNADTVYRAPASAFVARFVGTMNFLRVTVEAGASSVGLADGTRVPLTEPLEASGDVQIGVRPEDVRLTATADGAQGTVIRDAPLGHYRDVTVRLGGAELRAFAESGTKWAGSVSLRFERAVILADDTPADGQAG